MADMLYPLKFVPIYHRKPWGGNRIRDFFRRDVPCDSVGESWELSCRPEADSEVAEGPLRGRRLSRLIREYGEKLLGTRVLEKYGTDFPLLFKIIDASDRLSVQVHPDDNLARASGEKYGKDEIWYVIEAKNDAKLVLGFKDRIIFDKNEIVKTLGCGRVSQVLNEVPVKPGDFVPVPAGTVHALLDGLLVAEIQQNSNTTYRLYDWDRTDDSGNRRDLHVEKAIEAIRPDRMMASVHECAPVKSGEATVRKGPLVREFCVREISLEGEFELDTGQICFHAAMVISGSGKILHSGGSVVLASGDTVLVPASTGGYALSGNMKLLLVHMEPQQ